MEGSGHRSSCSYENPLAFQCDYVNWHPHQRLLHIWDWFFTQVSFWFELPNCSWLKKKLCAPWEVVRFRSVPYSPSGLRGRILKFLPQTYTPLCSAVLRGDRSCKCKAKKVPTPAAHSVLVVTKPWDEGSRERCHLLIHRIPQSSHPSSSPGWATNSDSNWVLSCESTLEGHWFPIAWKFLIVIPLFPSNSYCGHSITDWNTITDWSNTISRHLPPRRAL